MPNVAPKLKTLFLCHFLIFFSIIQEIKAQLTYSNPIVSGFNPDPSVCRVGNDYYIVNSSFGFFPGVPIHHSTDLINWTLIGYCLTRNTQLPLPKSGINDGIWAATIRYNNGVFYMITTNQTVRKNFIVTSTDPKGAWSEPIWLDLDGYDPSLDFIDGKCYLTYAFGGGENAIMQAEINPNTGKFITQPKTIWKGTGEFGTEGPHLYKIKNFFYLLVAEGGTGLMHSVSIARSKNPDGPWENCPSNPILTNRNKRWLRIQATGHADLVQNVDSSWNIVHLGIRNWGSFEEQMSVLGRETFILPVTWNKQGWPVINGNGTSELSLPTNIIQKIDTNTFLEKFDKSFSLPWNFIRNTDSSFFDFKSKPGCLTMKGSKANLDSNGKVAFAGFRQKHHGTRWVVKMTFEPTSENEEAGITVFMNGFAHYDFFISLRNKKKTLVARRVIDDMKYEQSSIHIKDLEITLLIETNPWAYEFFIINKNHTKTKVAHMQSQFISLKMTSGFTGMFLGLYATGNGKTTVNKAYFDESNYKEIKNW